MSNLLQKNSLPGSKIAKEWFAWLLVAPVLIYILLVMVYPFLYGVAMSFSNKKIGQDANFNGLTNYIKLLSDATFRKSIGNTLTYTFLAVAFKTIIGIGMALMLHSKIKMKNLSRGLLLIPWAVPTVMSVLTWKWMMADVGGVLTPMLRSIGLVSGRINWLASPSMAMFSVIMVNVWKGSAFIGISVLAGLQTVSHDMYEAATIDGAGPISKFFHITIPSVRKVIMLAVLVSTIWTFNDFEAIWLMTRGGPVNSTMLISVYSYVTGIRQQDLGTALAASVLFLPLMILLVNLVTGKAMKDD